MGQPVKLSDALVLNARLAGEENERSLAGQIEFWAGLGHAVERVLRLENILILKRLGAAKPLSECLREASDPGAGRSLGKVLKERPFPHFEPTGKHGLLVKIDEDGTRTVGRFVNRKFVPVR